MLIKSNQYAKLVNYCDAPVKYSDARSVDRGQSL